MALEMDSRANMPQSQVDYYSKPKKHRHNQENLACKVNQKSTKKTFIKHTEFAYFYHYFQQSLLLSYEFQFPFF